MKNPATRARSGSPVTSVPSTSGRSRRVRPASWAVIMTAVSAAVPTRPYSAQPAQSTSAAQLSGLGVESGQHLLERLMETGHALFLQGQADIVHINPDGGKSAHHLGRLVDRDVNGGGQHA